MLRWIDDGIILFDADGNVIEMNRRAEEILGAGGAGSRRTIREIIPGDYSPVEPYRDREIVLKGRDGPVNVLMTQITMTRKKDRSEKLLVLREITAKKRAEEALLREFNFKEAIINSSPAFICAINAQGLVLSMNNSLLQSLGYRGEEVAGRNFLEDFIPVSEWERLRAVIARIMEAREPVVFESGIVTRDKRQLLIEWRGRPVQGADARSEFFIAVGIDVTQQRKLEEDVLRARKLESLGVLAGGIAHDFNNLLAVVTGNISLAMAKNPTSETGQMLDEAAEAAMRARELTRQLLVFSKGGDPVLREASVQKFLADTVEYVMRGSRSKAEFDLAGDLWNVRADTGQISQVVQNLVLNAVEAMPDGGTVTISARNYETDTRTTHLPLEGKFVRIGIKDQGAGIARDNQVLIFDPYYSTKPGSHGLGLSIAVSIVQKHGGCVTVNSEPGAGALFEVYLPAVARTEAGEPSAPGERPDRPLRILLMDDESLILKMGSKMLGHLGCEVACAMDGLEAVSLYREALSRNTRFDLVIMDLTVPGGMGGREALKLMREFDGSVRAVVSSGYSNDPVMAQYREHGFYDVLGKPYRLSEMVELLARVLG